MSPLTAADRHVVSDRLFDFTMQEYAAPRSAATDGLSSASVLGASIDAAGPKAAVLRNAVSRLRSSLGRGRTIWAVIDSAATISWELYWYNHNDLPVVEVDQILDVLGLEPSGPWVSDVPRRPDVFSVDVDPALFRAERQLEAINVYVGNPVSPVPAGYSYRWTNAGPKLANAYYRFPRRMIEAARAQLTHAVHVEDVERLLWEDVQPCDSLHVANKTARDGLYYGGLDVDALALVLDRTESQKSVRAHLALCADRLRHLLFDVGVDVVRGYPGYAKVAVYGVL